MTLAELGQQMRDAQNAYYDYIKAHPKREGSRPPRGEGEPMPERQRLLIEARRLEGEFDRALKAILARKEGA